MNALTRLLGGVLEIAGEVVGSITWRAVLAVQVVGLVADTISNLIGPFPSWMALSRVIIDENIGLAVVGSALLGDRLAARGVRTWLAYGVPLVVVAPFAALFEFTLRGWLGAYTLFDKPGVDLVVRRTHIIYVACDIVTYGGMLIAIYLDYRRRVELARRVRAAELERARADAELVQSRLAELRADVEPDVLMAQLQRVRAMYDVDAARAERMLDTITDALRAKLSEARASTGVEA